MLTTRKKQNVIKDTQKHDTDTGSAEVQVGLLSREIEELTSHLKKNPKDNSSRRGLLKMVSKRRKLLDFLARTNEKGYAKLVKKLGLKK
ncbi:MAG: 30S ribosomal protein S15 [Patescibacteria group bacterium]|nr:30S ribosomal protein S15 [Patescibacteria group bacterium]